MASYFGIDTSNQTDLQYLVDAYKKTRQSELDKITTKKTALETTRTFWNKIQSGVTSLLSAADPFDLDNAPEKFEAKKVASSDTATVTATAGSNAPIGTTLIKVGKLAEKDLLLSDTFNIEEKFGEIGSKTFNIKTGDESYDVTVEFSGEETNAEAMQKIANAINDIEDVEVIAAFVKNTPKTGIISLMAGDTGEDFQLKISGSNDLLKKLGWDNLEKTNNSNDNQNPNDNASDKKGRQVAADGKAGYVYTDASSLNSQFTVNGIAIERASNSVDDVIDGLTFSLKKPQEADAQSIVLDSDIDVASVKTYVQPLLDKYNSLVSLLNTNKEQRRADGSISTLHNNLRFLSSEKITSVEGQTYNYLMSIGITVASDGSLKFTDDEKLYDALKANPEKVAQLFISEDSFKAKLDKILTDYEGDNNLIQLRTKSLNDQIERQDDRYESIEAQIGKEASNMANQYKAYIESYLKAQQQMSYLSTMGSGSSSSSASGSSYNSLLQKAYS